MWTEVLFVQDVSGKYNSVFIYKWIKNGFTDPKSFRGFQETGRVQSSDEYLVKSWLCFDNIK